ncbi:ABC transporter substrate-binding protein [Chitiniphilus shinanonensis]|uniref:ABC transporter substrate-binding protein n=1 Tax=Chitiniphilus shinanonensis TaxID=553088 RepID=UPI003059C4EE
MKPRILLSMLALAVAGAAQAQTTVEYWSNSLSPKFDGVMKTLTAQFNASQGEVKAVWVDVPWDSYQARVIAAVAGGNPPGLVNLTVPWMASMAQQGMLQPLDAKVAGFKQVYTPGALADVTYDGKLYGLPWYNQVAVLAYNKALFDQAGVKTPPRTTAETFAAARQIKQRTGVTGFIPKLNEEGITQVFLLEGLPLVQNGRAVFNSPAHVKLLEQYARAYKDGSIPPDVFSIKFENLIAHYGSGKVALLNTAPSALVRVKTDSPAIYAKTAVAPHPVGKAGVPPGNLFMWSVPKGYRNVDAAVALGRFLTNDASQLAFSRATETTLASTRAALADPYFQSGANSGDPAAKGRATAADSGATARTLVQVGLPDESAMIQRLAQALEEAVTGRKPVKQALDGAVAYWNERLAKQK